MQRDILSPTKGNVVYYRPDGTGRDSYIKDENGGFLGKDLIHSMRNRPSVSNQRMKFGKPTRAKMDASGNKFTHYISDGSGRDFYVTTNEGGNVSVPRWRDKVDFKFRSSLRDYNKLPIANPEKLDMFAMSQSQMTKSSAWQTQNLSQSQFSHTLRLSLPKTSKLPPPVSTYFPDAYNRSRSMRICEHSIGSK